MGDRDDAATAVATRVGACAKRRGRRQPVQLPAVPAPPLRPPLPAAWPERYSRWPPATPTGLHQRVRRAGSQRAPRRRRRARRRGSLRPHPSAGAAASPPTAPASGLPAWDGRATGVPPPVLPASPPPLRQPPTALWPRGRPLGGCADTRAGDARTTLTQVGARSTAAGVRSRALASGGARNGVCAKMSVVVARAATATTRLAMPTLPPAYRKSTDSRRGSRMTGWRATCRQTGWWMRQRWRESLAPVPPARLSTLQVRTQCGR